MQFIIFMFFLIFSTTSSANPIDNLKTDKDVEVFLKQVNKEFNLNKRTKLQVMSTGSIKKKMGCREIFTKWKIRNWEKADFNEDGLTDMIVTAYWYNNFEIYAIIDNGNNSFQFLRLSNVFAECEFAKPIKINARKYLLFYSKRELEDSATIKGLPIFKQVSSIDTLVYMHGGFVEVQDKIAHYEIDSIQFSSSSGWSGNSPEKKIRIFKDKSAQVTITTSDFANKDYSKFVNERLVSPILDIIGYIRIKDFKDRYRAPRTDMVGKSLKIFFKDGSTKVIEDDETNTAFGLTLLYKLLSKL